MKLTVFVDVVVDVHKTINFYIGFKEAILWNKSSFKVCRKINFKLRGGALLKFR